MVERVRTFVAIELPPGVQRGLAQLQERLKRSHPPVRWVAPDKIHLTLNFLGEIPAGQVAAAGEATAGVGAQTAPFAVEATGVGVFPNPHRPRVVWVGLAGDMEALRALQAGLTNALAARGFPPEDRPFSPHLTLGRVRQQARPEEARALGQAVTELHIPSLGRWQVEQVLLIRSDLRPEGPIYTPLRVVPLGKP